MGTSTSTPSALLTAFCEGRGLVLFSLGLRTVPGIEQSSALACRLNPHHPYKETEAPRA